MSRADYRPLNVRDALSYLDKVKIQFVDKPDVYNRFLDVMKEFKSQVIDTPGVIDRVSNLFKGHPTLIQGFNTFLPPGYRIECFKESDGKDMITVTTPRGIIRQTAGSFSAASLNEQTPIVVPSGRGKAAAARAEAAAAAKAAQAAPPPAAEPSSSRLSAAPPALSTAPASRAPAAALPQTAPSPFPNPHQVVPAPTHLTHFVVDGTPIMRPAHEIDAMKAKAQAQGLTDPTTPGAASALASAGAPRDSGQLEIEFNHAITYVNKIKSRFKDKPNTYKQFLEILQTYQRDGRAITEVYDEVSALFATAPDLIGEFKQFLPDDSKDSAVFSSLMNADRGYIHPNSIAGKRAAAAAAKETTRKKRGPATETKASKRSKTAQRAESPPAEDENTILSNMPQTLASPEDVSLFDKIKKYIDDKITYHEFLKLVNLWTQNFIDLQAFVDRAHVFIGQSPDLWASFRRVVNADEHSVFPVDPQSSQGGYGFGGMINIDNSVAENTPMLERVKPDLGGPRVKSHGPSYRKLPKTEVNLTCTGRDAMCWEVLNDEWVSHPIWAAEDAAPFMTHKKNAYEEALHKSEEERHEYDYHIEANIRTIALLEPLNTKIQTMEPEERAHFNLKAGIGGQSKSIYQRIIKKVYGKEVGPDVIKALHDNPVVTLPIVLERLKSKDEEWKKAQRDWNRVWREQDAKNFYRALDHQGVQFKANDKKTIGSKNLIAEAELRKREQENARDALVDATSWRSRVQFEFDFSDKVVLRDSIKLVLSYLDRLSALGSSDRHRIEKQLQEVLPLLFMIDKDEFNQEFGFGDVTAEDSVDGDSADEASMADEDETASASAARKAKKGPVAADLRMKLLKQVGEKEGRGQRGSTMTPGPEDGAAEAQDRMSVEGTPMTDQGDRAETPLPVPADPAAVAEAVEKDRAGAEASEQTWVNIEPSQQSQTASAAPSESGELPQSQRKANFFTNGNYYVLIRLIQILYSRLLTCKNLAKELAAIGNQPINPAAITLGLSEPDIQYFGIEHGENPAKHYYSHLLMAAERLFDGEIDANGFEDILRVMFGTKGYIMFTLDRVLSAIIKQIQTIIGDLKSQELCALLSRDRVHEQTSTRQQIAYRMQAESVIGPDEHLFKIEFLAKKNVVTIQLLGKGDTTVDDAVTTQEKWQQYIDSYTLTHPTEGLGKRVKAPFLRRNLETVSTEAQATEFIGREGLSLKIALGSYRMFFVPETEDYFHRRRTEKGYEALEAKEAEDEDEAYENFAEKYVDAEEEQV